MLQLESLEFDFRCKTVSNKSSEWLDNDGHESKLLSRFSDDDQANSKSHFTIDHAHLLRLLQSTEWNELQILELLISTWTKVVGGGDRERFKIKIYQIFLIAFQQLA